MERKGCGGLSCTAIVDSQPICTGCGKSAGNFAYGWNIVCLMCLLKQFQFSIKCQKCSSSSLLVSNFWSQNDLTTEYTCAECCPYPLNHNSVLISAECSDDVLDIFNIIEIIKEFIDSPHCCVECGSQHIMGLAIGEVVDHIFTTYFSVCMKCADEYKSNSSSQLPFISIKILPSGRFMTL